MTAELISRPARRRGSSWAGRASQRRREQVGDPVGGPDTPVQHLWESLVEVLRSIDSPSSALLCTADGAPVAAYGLPTADLPRASRRTERMFATRMPADCDVPDVAPEGVETLELTAGGRHTVIASVPAPHGGHHLLSVTAEGVSQPVLEAWIRHVAEDLRELLSDQPSSTSSSAAE